MPINLPPTPAVGATWHYERTNRGGGEAEQVYVHRAAASRLIVYKMRERCTHAALVSAEIDPATGEASRLDAGGLLPGGRAQPYGVITFDPGRGLLHVDITVDGAPRRRSVAVAARPWHLYDYDLATLSAGTRAMAHPRRGFSFGMALSWNDPEKPEEILRWIGPANARFVRAERHLGRAALRFAVSGDAFGKAGGGPLCIDARDRSILDVQWGRPNHKEYRDFRLRLIRCIDGERARRDLLAAHFASCPA